PRRAGHAGCQGPQAAPVEIRSESAEVAGASGILRAIPGPLGGRVCEACLSASRVAWKIEGKWPASGHDKDRSDVASSRRREARSQPGPEIRGRGGDEIHELRHA